MSVYVDTDCCSAEDAHPYDGVIDAELHSDALRGVFDAERIVLSALQVPDRRNVPGERRPHQRLHRV